MEFLTLLFLFSITLHNLEEALWLPKWSEHAGRFQKRVEPNEFRFAIIVITLFAYLTVFFYYVFNNTITTIILVGFLGAMVFNAIFPHLLATIVLKQYAPGVLTGVLLNIPINSYIIYRFIEENLITLFGAICATILIGIILLSFIPVLFKIGSRIMPTN
ncbi:HXXEE domain-containing protein [Gracilibacillus xinjiangensis]|uniref:HXXEE domain-containing protein n=1 Tax=Gracilibacillus xinjiangensis TaxID=1193282 RepID=A0ABV8WXC2_9BACI